MCLVLIGGCITQSTENSAPFDAVMPTADGPTTTETVQTADMSVPFDMGTGESDMAMAFDAETLSPAQLSVVIDGVPIESSHVHDFGRLEQHDVAFQMITLTNIGQRILAITSIELSEGLSVITDTIPAALMPGEVIDLNVSIDTSRANAAFASTLLIRLSPSNIESS